MGAFGGDFAVGRLAPPGVTALTSAFAITPRPQTTLLVKINDSFQPCVLKIKVGGQWMDPEG